MQLSRLKDTDHDWHLRTIFVSTHADDDVFTSLFIGHAALHNDMRPSTMQIEFLRAFSDDITSFSVSGDDEYASHVNYWAWPKLVNVQVSTSTPTLSIGPSIRTQALPMSDCLERISFPNYVVSIEDGAILCSSSALQLLEIGVHDQDLNEWVK